MNKLLRDIAPSFSQELEAGLIAEQELELAAQVPALIFQSFNRDPAEEILMVYVRGGRKLNMVETQVIGEKYGGSIVLESVPGIVVVDIDNFSRVKSIEVIGRPEHSKEFLQNVT